MSDVVVARAPGKLFLLGEYAVLDGCPAVVAAYHAVLSRLAELGQRACSLTIVSTLAGEGGAKVGLGSSAAVAVAAVAALAAAAGADLDRQALFGIAFAAHRAAQGSIGSGADVAASVYGGLVRFQPRGQSLPAVTPLALPGDAQLLVAWSGAPASTADLVQQYLSARNGSAVARAAFVAASRRAVDLFVGGLQHGTLSHAAIDANAKALDRLGRQLGLPIVTSRLAQLIAVARAHGAAAKTSGAGGGDCGIALTRDLAAAERIRGAWRAAQLVPLDVAPDPTGVTIARC